jgi:hypothetical protein
LQQLPKHNPSVLYAAIPLFSVNIQNEQILNLAKTRGKNKELLSIPLSEKFPKIPI